MKGGQKFGKKLGSFRHVLTLKGHLCEDRTPLRLVVIFFILKSERFFFYLKRVHEGGKFEKI